MFIRSRYLDYALRMNKPTKIASTIILIQGAVIASNLDLIQKYFFELGWVSLLLNIITIGLRYLTATLFGLSLPQKITISIETGVQNGTLAIVIASSIPEQLELSLPAVIYGLIMFFSGRFMMMYFGKKEATID